MAKLKSAVKRHKQSLKRRARNRHVRSTVTSAVKEVRAGIAIFERVWLGRAVSEAVLTTAIRQIRNALGDDARNPAFIETVHGRGYRFLASVTSETEPTEAPAPAVVVRVRRRFVPAFALLGAAMATLLAWIVWGGNFSFRPELPVHPKSIAILPLSDLSQGRDAQWFADGLTEELLNSLSRAPDIRVASRGAGQSAGNRAKSGGDGAAKTPRCPSS